MKKVDLTRHFLIPKHTKLSDKEGAELLKRYNAGIANLPRILKSDAAIAHLSPKAGEIIKIVKKSFTAGESVFYRVVIDA